MKSFLTSNAWPHRKCTQAIVARTRRPPETEAIVARFIRTPPETGPPLGLEGRSVMRKEFPGSAPFLGSEIPGQVYRNDSLLLRVAAPGFPTRLLGILLARWTIS